MRPRSRVAPREAPRWDAVASSLLRHRTHDNEELYGAKFGAGSWRMVQPEGDPSQCELLSEAASR